MMNPNHVIIYFNRPVTVKKHSAKHRCIGADGVDLDESIIVASGKRFVKIKPDSCEVRVSPQGDVTILEALGSSTVITSEVDVIRELETWNTLFANPNPLLPSIVISLDQRAFTNWQPVFGGALPHFTIQLDQSECIPLAWVKKWDMSNPWFMLLELGIEVERVNSNFLAVSNAGEPHLISTKYVLEVYEKGGKKIWRKPFGPTP